MWTGFGGYHAIEVVRTSMHTGNTEVRGSHPVVAITSWLRSLSWDIRLTRLIGSNEYPWLGEGKR